MHRRLCELIGVILLGCASAEYDSDGSKQIQFSLLNTQDVVKLSEFQVTHRDLYTAVDRQPVKNGVLDRRLVRNCSSYHSPSTHLSLCCF